MAKKPPARLRTGRTTEKARALFLAALSKCGNIGESCRAAGIGRSTLYEHRAKSRPFSAAWDAALDEAADVLEAEVRRRGMTGVLTAVYHRGKVVGRVRRYSDTLLIFLLKSVKPERFDDQARLRKLAAAGDLPAVDTAMELARLTQQMVGELEGLAHGVNLRAEK